MHRDGAMHIETNCAKKPKILWDSYLSVPIDEFDYRFLNATVLRLQYRTLSAGHSLTNKHTCTHWLMCTNLRQNARDNHNVMVLLIFFSLPFCPTIFRCRYFIFLTIMQCYCDLSLTLILWIHKLNNRIRWTETNNNNTLKWPYLRN